MYRGAINNILSRLTSFIKIRVALCRAVSKIFQPNVLSKFSTKNEEMSTWNLQRQCFKSKVWQYNSALARLQMYHFLGCQVSQEI